MPAFSPATAPIVRPRCSAWSRPIGRHDGGGRPLDHVGGVGAAPQAHLEQERVGRRLGEEEKGGGGGDLEHGDRLRPVRRLAAPERLDEPLLVDEAPAADAPEPHPLVEAHEMGRGVDVHALPRGLQDRAHEGDGRALAVRPRHVDDRRQAPLRVVEPREQPLDAAEREVDRLGVKRQEAREKRVGGVHQAAGAGTGSAASGSGGGSSTAGSGAGAFIRRRQRRATVPFKAWRWTTWSTVPCSRRYSAR